MRGPRRKAFSGTGTKYDKMLRKAEENVLTYISYYLKKALAYV